MWIGGGGLGVGKTELLRGQMGRTRPRVSQVGIVGVHTGLGDTRTVPSRYGLVDVGSHSRRRTRFRLWVNSLSDSDPIHYSSVGAPLLVTTHLYPRGLRMGFGS